MQSFLCLKKKRDLQHLQHLTYDATVSAFQCWGGGSNRSVVGGAMLAVVVVLPSSRRLQRGAGGGAATGQTGGRRHPLWERVHFLSNSLVLFCLTVFGSMALYCAMVGLWMDCYLPIVLAVVRGPRLSTHYLIPQQEAQPGHQSISCLIYWGRRSQLIILNWKVKRGPLFF